MKIKPKLKKSDYPAPKSFRLSMETIKKLDRIVKETGKGSGEIVAELIDLAYRDTVKSK